MRITKKNLKNGEVSLIITNNEDLWHLSHVLEENDQIKGSTERKIKIGSSENTKVTRKKVFLTIKTEKIEYEPENNSLRALGVITQAPEEVPLGEHHSFNLQINDSITIRKTSWPNYVLDKLTQATKEKAPILLTVFDREEAHFAELKNNGYNILSSIKGDVQKKQDETVKSSNFYKEISKQIEEYVKRKEIKHLIIGAPAFWKEYLLKELSDNIKKITTSTTVSQADESGFQEILKKTELKKVLEDERTATEMQAIEEIMHGIQKEKAFYGYKETKTEVETGAAKNLLVSENFLKKMKEKNKYAEIDYFLKNAENMKTKIMVISGKDTSKKLDSLGGIAGLKRW